MQTYAGFYENLDNFLACYSFKFRIYYKHVKICF